MKSNNSKQIIKIGISGKRNINNNEKEVVKKSIEAKIKTILKENNANEFIGFSALAIGADTIFADIVVNVFKMQLNITLPFPIDEYESDFTTDEDVLKLNGFLENNKEIQIVTNTIPTNNDERSDAYFNVGKFIVDNCDEVIFVWDELKPEGKGGTAEVIGYYSETKNVIPVDYILVTPATDDLIHIEINKEYELSNNQAMQSRDDYKLIWKLAIILGWSAVGLFAANTAFHFKGLFNLIGVSIEFILVIVTFALIIKAKKKDYHGKYLSNRLRAETLRIVRYNYHSNRVMKLSAHTNSKDKDLSALVEKINQAVTEGTYTSKWYTNYSIKSLIEDQKTYHKNKVISIGSKFHLFEQFNLAIAIFFIINLTIHLISAVLKYYNESLSIYSHDLIVFISILLPASYAAFEGVIYFQEWAKLKKYSTSAEESLEESLQKLPANMANTDDNICYDKQAVTLNLVSSIMLTDNGNWHLILEDKNNYHWVI